MKPKTSYAIITLLVEMILLPILITGGSILASAFLSNLTSASQLGSYERRLVYILISLLGPLLLGAITGYILSKGLKVKPTVPMQRYFPAFFPMILALVTAVIISISTGNDYNSGYWGLYTLKNPTFIFFNFVVAFSGNSFIIPIVEISGYCGFVIGFLLQEKVNKTIRKEKSARNLKVFFAALSLSFLVFSYFHTKNIIENGILELRYGNSTIAAELTEFDLLKIAPFKENNGLAKLEKEASLQFTDLAIMPRLDGATAAYPVYASFVQAVYKGLGDYYEANKNSSEKDIYSAFVDAESYPLNIVRCTKTNGAYERLINEETDIIFTAEPSSDQLEQIKAKGDEFVLTPIGSEAFVFFTNINNPVENLSIEQIQDIYSGKIANWKDVGGPNRSVLPYQRPQNSGSQTIMENKVMRDIKMMAPTKDTFASGMGGIINKVASYKNANNAIGYSFMYYSSSMIRNNQIKYIAVNDIMPTPETVRNKTYPFTVPVYAVTLKSNKNQNVAKMLNWILSEEGQGLIEKTGYVPIK
jgi:phosphate transport system substrate-binding protein